MELVTLVLVSNTVLFLCSILLIVVMWIANPGYGSGAFGAAAGMGLGAMGVILSIAIYGLTLLAYFCGPLIALGIAGLTTILFLLMCYLGSENPE